MKYLKTSTPLLIAIALLCASVAVFSYVYAKIESINQQTAGTIQDLALSSTKEEQLRGIKALLSDTAAARESANSYFIGPDGVVDFLKTIEGMGRATHVTLSVDSVNVDQPETASATIQSVPISLKLSGSFSNVTRFLYEFERLPVVGDTSFARFTRFDSASSTTWSASISARFFKLVP